MRMRFDLPVVVEGKAEGSRKRRVFAGHVATECEVVDISQAELSPVAVVERSCHWLKGMKRPDQRLEYASFDGRLFSRCVPEGREADDLSRIAHGGVKHAFQTYFSNPILADESRRIMDMILARGNEGRVVPQSISWFDEWSPRKTHPLDTLGIAEDVSSQVCVQVEAFQAKTREFILVDGRPWRMEAEPLIRIVPHHIHRFDLVVERRGWAHERVPDVGHCTSAAWFRLDEAMQAVEYCAALNDATGNEATLTRYFDIEVLDGSELKAAPEAVAFADIAKGIVESAIWKEQKTFVEWFRDADRGDVAALKTLLVHAKLGRNETLPTDFEAALRHVADDRTGEWSRVPDTRLLGYLRCGLDRWDARPILAEVAQMPPRPR